MAVDERTQDRPTTHGGTREREKRERGASSADNDRRTAHEGEHRLFGFLGLGAGARTHAGDGRLGEGAIGVALVAGTRWVGFLGIGAKLAVVGTSVSSVSSSGGATATATAGKAHSPQAFGEAAAAPAPAPVGGVVGGGDGGGGSRVAEVVWIVVQIRRVVPRGARGRGRGRSGYHCCCLCLWDGSNGGKARCTLARWVLC